ncbi:MAG TPA: DUF1559 domain-containing protein, partial [Planctomycetia bacterium]|nr:DUF1559 domain-containing protein [Planctomycetia bacterium]
SCPDGGTVRLDGVCAECSRHGRCDFMIPNAEAPLESVTRDEAQQYAAFLQEYNQYWRTFFDPIAIRIKADADRYRAETIVLPLINSSVYQNVAGMVGGKPEPLDAMPVPARNIFSLAFRVPKERAMEELGLSAPTPVEKRADAGAASEAQAVESLRMIGLALHNYADSYRWFPSAVGFDKQGGKTRLGWRVAILPYLEEQALFDQFRHDEPWDGPHNKALIAKMPKIYRSGDAKLDAEGKTTFTSPRGKNTLFPAENRAGRKLSDVLDGLSFTVMAVEADAAHAVTWTAPDDLPFDPATPFKGWRERPRGRMLLTADGAVHYLPTHVPAARAATYFTVAGGEVNQGEGDFDTPQFRGQGGGPVGSRSPVPPEIAEELKLKALLERGVGNQVGVHVYDAQQLIDFNLPSFLGMGLGSFGGRGMFGNGEAFVGFAIAALTSPVYVSIPVRDRAIVDECLTRLDALLLKQSREREGFGFFSFSQDYYSFAAGDAKVRTYAVQIGPVRWRMFAARIGDGLYVASKPFILEDLAAAWKTAPQSVPADPGPAAHAIVRLRPQNWNQTLPDYRLG